MFYSHLVAFDWFVERSDTATNHWMLSPVDLNFPVDDGHIQSIKQVRMWATSFHFLLRDNTGMRYFEEFLEREFSGENLRFWCKVNLYKSGMLSKLPVQALAIFEEFLGEDATSEINIDAKILEDTIEGVQTPDRFTYEEAQEHIYTLMKTDSYVRFLRSEDYKQCLREAHERQTNPIAFKKKLEAREKAAAKAAKAQKLKEAEGRILPPVPIIAEPMLIPGVDPIKTIAVPDHVIAATPAEFGGAAFVPGVLPGVIPGLPPGTEIPIELTPWAEIGTIPVLPV